MITLKQIVIPENYFVNIDPYNAMWYDKHIIWTKSYSLSPVEKFIENNYSNFNLSSPEYRIEDKKTALNNQLCNVIRTTEKGKLLIVSCSKDHYTMPRIYGMPHFSYHFIVKGLKALIDNEYLEVRKGYFFKDIRKGKLTRVWPTEKLVNELNSYGEEFTISENDLVEYELNCKRSSAEFERVFYDDPIILKSSKKNGIKRIINKKFDKKNHAEKIFLIRYNNFISKFDVRLFIEETSNNKPFRIIKQQSNITGNGISPPILGKTKFRYRYNKKLDCRLYRVFNNGKYTEGGRFYGAQYQGRSEKERGEITIDGERVIEIDYSGLHGRMLYQCCKKIDYQDDPYFIDEETKELRKAYKKMFQMMINARGQVRAIEAFKKNLIEDDGGSELRELMNKHGINDYRLYEKIASKHKAVEDYFSSGKGLSLQYVDSQIAENILKHFTYRNKPCLCIHDSFIVQENYGDELIDVMRSEYKKIVGYNCKLKLSNGEVI